MEHYVGLDVSLKLTAICVVDQASFSNPMMEGPWRRFRREARARE